ncbi:hypothetical protein WJX81_001439 [Elliptochloris bilobata]|uniref:Protein kinase domain-containing protein n=1 Tax=Elliptochloris bilobata TaxID=381761 RepID=A0AAW1RU60_9CHLO
MGQCLSTAFRAPSAKQASKETVLVASADAAAASRDCVAQVPGKLQHTDASRHPPDCGISTSGPDKARAAAATDAFFSSKQSSASAISSANSVAHSSAASSTAASDLSEPAAAAAAATSYSIERPRYAAPVQPFEPYDAWRLGPPVPACQDGRIAAACAIAEYRTPSDPSVEQVLQVLCTCFDVDSSTCTLLTGECIYILNACGCIKPGMCPWRWGFCGWSFLPSNTEVLAVEDLGNDARFSDNAFVLEEPKLAFYLAAPLVTTNGHRLGTLCVVGQKARRFSAEQANMLAGMAELVVRTLESSYALELAKRRTAALRRAVDTYTTASLFVTAREGRWALMHMNDSALRLAGLPSLEPKTDFWDVFRVDAGREGEGFFRRAALQNIEFSMTVFLRADVAPGNSAGSGAQPRRYVMTFRPAGSALLDSNTDVVGIPAFLPMDPATTAGFYFVTAREAAKATSTGSGTRSGSVTNSGGGGSSGSQGRRPLLPGVLPFEGLQLGPPLGKGGYGVVYRGLYKDQLVAVKVIEDTDAVRMHDGRPLEAVITEKLHHPNLVMAMGYATVPGRDQYNPHQETWLLLDFCDRGCLIDAIERGWFTAECSLIRGEIDYGRALALAAQIASAMAFLHANSIVHGDLTGGNVLLASAPGSPIGVCAKVADFGLSRNMDVQTRVETRTYGTITHMAPEVLRFNQISKAADVYSFGVILWELAAGCRAWVGMVHTQIVCAVAVDGQRLGFPKGVRAPPRAYQALASRC